MDKTTLRQQAYDYIQQRIASGLLPAGSWISELSLAKEIGISRTPVREAIRQLQLEGLVEQVPRHGTVVRQPDQRDIAELYELRQALECYAVGQAAERIGSADLATLADLCDEIRSTRDKLKAGKATALSAAMMKRFLAADMQFHQLLLRAAGNRRIVKIVSESRVLARIFGSQRHRHDLDVVTRTHRFHTQIMRAVKAGNVDAARQAMAEHIQASKAETLKHFERVQTSAAAI